MQTFHRICVTDYERQDKYGHTFTLERGKEYLTSDEEDGEVTVFSTYWVKVSVDLFGGGIEFTPKQSEPCIKCGK